MQMQAQPRHQTAGSESGSKRRRVLPLLHAAASRCHAAVSLPRGGKHPTKEATRPHLRVSSGHSVVRRSPSKLVAAALRSNWATAPGRGRSGAQQGGAKCKLPLQPERQPSAEWESSQAGAAQQRAHPGVGHHHQLHLPAQIAVDEVQAAGSRGAREGGNGLKRAQGRSTGSSSGSSCAAMVL